MRVALINEGTYPYVLGGVSTWCDQLVRGLPEVTWHLVTVVGTAPGEPALPLPDTVASLTPVPVWGPADPPRPGAAPLAARLLRAMLGDGPADAAAFRAALRALALPDAAARTRWCRRCRSAPSACGRHGPPGHHPLHGVPLAEILCEVWDLAGQGGAQLPRLSLRDADEAAMLLEHALRPLGAHLPPTDLCHANANGLSALVALAAKWRWGVPFLLTEHGVYLRERYLAAGSHPPAVKVALLRFHRALARLAYAEAAVVTPVSSFNRRWEERHGAPPGRVTVIPNGVAPERFPPLPGEPADPVIAWVGRVDPLKDLHTLIKALAAVRREIPAARLHLAGPVPSGNEVYAESCHRLVEELGLAGAVTFAGPVASSRDAFAQGQVAALSSISEGMPYTVVEAMMCRRATISTDVGGVAEAVGDGGLVVPPRDPEAFAAACVKLLRDRDYRESVADRGHRRALANFTLERCLDAYRRQYRKLLAEAAPVDAVPVEAVP